MAEKKHQKDEIISCVVNAKACKKDGKTLPFTFNKTNIEGSGQFVVKFTKESGISPSESGRYILKFKNNKDCVSVQNRLNFQGYEEQVLWVKKAEVFEPADAYFEDVNDEDLPL